MEFLGLRAFLVPMVFQVEMAKPDLRDLRVLKVTKELPVHLGPRDLRVTLGHQGHLVTTERKDQWEK